MNWEIFSTELIFGIKVSLLINTDMSLESSALNIILLLYLDLLEVK